MGGTEALGAAEARTIPPIRTPSKDSNDRPGPPPDGWSGAGRRASKEPSHSKVNLGRTVW
jgi:hypothetical protein